MSRFNARKTIGMFGAAIAAAVSLSGMTAIAHAEDVKNSAAVQGAPAAKSWQTGLHRTDLVKRDLGVSDREVIQVRVDFDPGVAAPKHSHPGVEVAYVISGTFKYELEGQPAVTLKAGDSLYIPEGTAHIATNIGSTTGSELATYIVKKDTPIVILSK
ncbi:cupin domain-containing protein [Pseudomonas sp. REP124]|uniref:cupin domain-containing protein n=1 Tax=Pseudomonas sp. REP124 TaxID=2875731 RepID=UPI001CC9A354|nr:cupin domain-containing protein [Pseudomonas sp. REP124]MBZ9783133.1 cupin domain-containing protein [Pseudomonas sp. REP124]